MDINITKYILSLKKESDRVKTFINIKLPNIRKKYVDVRDALDKHYDEFKEQDGVTQSFNIRLSYQSFSGYKGNGYTHSDFQPDHTIFAKYFIEYLNKHTTEIFNEMADRMKEDAILEKNKALQELDTLKDNIVKIV